MTSQIHVPHPLTRLTPWETWPVSVVAMQREAPEVYSYDLQFASDEVACRYDFQPGQFNMLYLPGAGEIAISIAGRAPGTALVRHTVRSVGAVTGTLQRLGLGGQLGLRGPFGSHWPVELLQGARGAATDRPDLLIVAGGIGLAPLRALLDWIVQRREGLGEVTLLLGARTPEDLIYQGELPGWQAAGIRVGMTVDRPSTRWEGQVGVVTLLLERVPVPHPERTLLFTCGPEVMMRYVIKTASQRGIPETNLYVSLERNMNCAIGLCGHCQLGTELICRDGPVFRHDRVGPLLRVTDL
jgi:NAD(P)H-flavin reductase